MSNIIEVKHLSKSFHGKKAVDDLSFSVTEGQLFAFLGQNGAGKSTTINMLVGLSQKDSGEIQYENGKQFSDFKNNIGVVFQNNVFENLLTVKENILFYGALSENKQDKDNKRYDELMELFSLRDVEKQKFGTLSGGQKRKAEIARAIWGNPKILFLDEPTTGLDPKTRNEVWHILRNLQQQSGMTVFLTTHYMEETEDADEVVIIHKGKKIATGSPAELKALYSKDSLQITPKNAEFFEKKLSEINEDYKKTADTYTLFPDNSQKAISLLTMLNNNINYFEMKRGSMDDVFLAAVGEKI
ncbi:MAG: ABC transporter ATP-binding protein [Oscillospiraceae bacterium]|jgi:multidrug/hemolysin transport system ATP-binding protein|nr:ABC transporter ATP-binding protein [Oscillospiraceae bacterium]